MRNGAQRPRSRSIGWLKGLLKPEAIGLKAGIAPGLVSAPLFDWRQLKKPPVPSLLLKAAEGLVQG